MTTSGAIVEGAHRLPIRVYYEDTDAGGIVYHAGYLRFAERARTETMRCLGLEHTALRSRFGLIFAVRRCAIDYLAPARLDDVLEVRTRLERMRGASFDLMQDVLRREQPLVRIGLRLALLDQALRAARIPAELRARFEPLLAPVRG